VAVSFFLIVDSHSKKPSALLLAEYKLFDRFFKFDSFVRSFFNSAKIQDELKGENVRLLEELLTLKAQMGEKNIQSDNTTPFEQYKVHTSQVVNNTLCLTHNTITINKGKAEGVKEGMGIISHRGVAGVVSNVSEHFSVAISVINPHCVLSCKIKNTDYFGSLTWDGKDYGTAVLYDLPRYSKVEIGDTIVTTGYSVAFPEGILVGVVKSEEDDDVNNFRKLNITFFTDFSTLRHVFFVENTSFDERIELETKNN